MRLNSILICDREKGRFLVEEILVHYEAYYQLRTMIILLHSKKSSNSQDPHYRKLAFLKIRPVNIFLSPFEPSNTQKIVRVEQHFISKLME
jgi:hypothetical protein